MVYGKVKSHYRGNKAVTSFAVGISFFVGLVVVRNSKFDDVGMLGDNVPTTLIEGLGR